MEINGLFNLLNFPLRYSSQNGIMYVLYFFVWNYGSIITAVQIMRCSFHIHSFFPSEM